MHLLDFFLKEVLLVEKEHNGRGREELVVADAVEQVQGLVHAILGGGNTSEAPGWAYGMGVCLLFWERLVPNAKSKIGNSLSL